MGATFKNLIPMLFKIGNIFILVQWHTFHAVMNSAILYWSPGGVINHERFNLVTVAQLVVIDFWPLSNVGLIQMIHLFFNMNSQKGSWKCSSSNFMIWYGISKVHLSLKNRWPWYYPGQKQKKTKTALFEYRHNCFLMSKKHLCLYSNNVVFVFVLFLARIVPWTSIFLT